MINNTQNNILEQISEEYWLQKFSDDIPITSLLKFNQDKQTLGGRKSLTIPLPDKVYEPLMKICKNSDLGFYIFLLTALNGVLSKYGKEETLVGSTGFKGEKNFTSNNLLFLRNTIFSNQSFKEVLGTVKKTVLDAMKYQIYPTENLEEKLSQRGLYVDDLFHIAFISENIHERSEVLNRFDIVITYIDKPSRALAVNFVGDIYEEVLITQFIQHFINYLQLIPEHFNYPLNDINILTDEDMDLIIHRFNGTNRDFPSDTVFQQLFENQVEKTPSAIAVEYEGKKLSYDALNKEANKLAHLLREKAVTRDHVVGILFERSHDMLIAILAVFKAGGAYIPIDTNYPNERIKTVLDESRTQFLLTNTSAIEDINNFYAEIASGTTLEYIVSMDNLESLDTSNQIFRTHRIAACLIEGKDINISKDMVFCYGELVLKGEELIQRAGKLARFLKNICPNTLIGLMIENPVFQIIACIALKEARLTFHVHNPLCTSEELINTLHDTSIKLILSESTFLDKVDRVLWESETMESYILLDDYIFTSDHTESQYKEIWNLVAEDSTEEINDYGWSNSYTDEKFSHEEMNEYIENFKFKLQPYLKRDTKVFEIGCGHGLVLFNIASQVKYYLATDLSEVIIEKNRQRARREGLHNIDFQAMSAAGINQAKETGFDLIICSSVVHYFPNTLYLEKVIKSAIDLLSDEGIIYLDDVMNLTKKAELIESVKSYKKQHPDAPVKLDWDSDLFVSKEFFHLLQHKYSEIISFEVSNKFGEIDNELTRFRFDVIIKVKKNTVVSTSQGIDLKGETNFEHVIPAVYSKNRWTIQDTSKTSPISIECFSSSMPSVNIGQVLDLSIMDKYSMENPEIINKPSDLSYVIYTSGSTGKPKGAMVEHIGMINHLYAKIHETSLNDADVVVQNASHCFDISVWQFLSALVVGAKTVIYSNELMLNPDQLIKQVQKDQVTILEVVPTYLGILLDILEYTSEKNRELMNLQYLFVTGEVVKNSLVQRWFIMYSAIKMVNAYGPTEASDDITHYVMEQAPEEERISIGYPLQNFNIYIVDANLKLCPVGVKGELCVSGIGVGRGYLNDPEKTAKVFLEDPFCEEKGVRMYKTGDLACFLPDGRLEFFGRKDYQVKIRGFRIELGEIENKLAQYENIKEAVVIDKENEDGSKYLIGYYVAIGEPSISELRDHLTMNLPDYMVPEYFVQLEQIPLTPNGKMDRKALPDPNINVTSRVEYVAHTNKIEESLVQIWMEVLSVEKIGINDNFFEIGGHSLRATMLVGKIHKTFNIDIPLREVFRLTTVKEQAEYLLGAKESMYSSIEKAPIQEYYEASSAQKRTYILNQIDSAQTAYNLPSTVILEGNVDIYKIEETLRKIIRRHENLRTSFEMIEGSIVQKVGEEVAFSVKYEEIETKSTYEQDKKINDLINQFIKPFDLSIAPLLRVNIVKMNTGKYLMMFDMHHIISDGISTGILIDEFVMLYAGKELPELIIQYKDYAVWQNELIRSGGLKEQEKYWMEVFKGEIPVLNLPLDYRRPVVQNFVGKKTGFTIDVKLKQKLMDLAKIEGVTMYMLLLAGYTTLLHKYTGQEDIIVGSPIAGRRHDDLNNIIGMFVNTLAMRNNPSGEQTFREYLSKVKDNALKAFENQDYQFEELVEKVDANRDMSRNALFDTMLAFQNTEIAELDIEGLKLSPYISEHNISKFDISIYVAESMDGLEIVIEYSTALFKGETIERMKGHLVNVLREVVENPDTKLNKIEIMTPEEKNSALNELNDTYVEYPKDKTIHELFEERVEKVPENIAVVLEDNHLTYSELNERANSLVRVLRNKGVVPDEIVGIMVENSIELIVGILGILKAGGAYLPIDPSLPQERIEYMLNDSNMKILLSQSEFLESIDFQREVINLENEELYKCENSNLQKQVNSENLAYVTYTPDTTGKPKGVMVMNKGLVNYITWANKVYVRGDNIDFALYSSLSFDLTITSIFTPLVSGNRIVIYKQDDNETVIRKVFNEKRVQLVKLTPAHLEIIKDMDHSNSSITRLIVGGEELKTSLANSIHLNFKGNVEIYNEYGPTETVVGCMIYKYNFEKDNDKTIPIGKPADNINIYILDDNMKVLPIGVCGEIFIGGEGVAKGYLNRLELTEEKFVDNPFMNGTKLYKTGDLAKRLSDGNIEYMGRIDHQVKVKGYRVELGEIESNLLNYGVIQEALVITREDKTESKYICAYIVAESDLNVSEIREFLSKQLPDYMIPSYFIQLEKMPLNPNGKIDRNGLPKPAGETNKGEYVSPNNEVQERLIEVWKEVLGVSRIGIKDNFFALGGNSIKAIQIVTRANQENIIISVKDVLSYPTVESIIENVDYIREKNQVSQSEVVGEISLTPIQKWFFEQNFEKPHYWNQQNFFTIKDDVDLNLLEKSIQKIIEHHDALRINLNFVNGEVIARNRGIDEVKFKLEKFDLSTLDGKKQLTALKEISEDLKDSLELEKDLFFKVVIFDLGSSGKRLLMSSHHLVIDVISWQILLKDLQSLYFSNLNGELPAKTVSFKEWSEKLQNYARSKLFETHYWHKIDIAAINSLSRESVYKLSREDYKKFKIELSVESTRKLLTEVNFAYNTEINDILLSVLLLAYTDVSDNKNLLLEMEGHGREEFERDLDVSRTIGWFTNIYPVFFEKQPTLGETIKYVKESLRTIPNKGLNFGIGRHILQDQYLEQINPEISFNYMGELDGVLREKGEVLLSSAEEDSGGSVHPENHSTHLLDLSGFIMDNKLQMIVHYNSRYVNDEMMQKFAECYPQRFEDIIDHCIGQKQQTLTASDFGAQDKLDQEGFDLLAQIYGK
ncbi:non-ribosomal peptide synthetase [Chengkuizengella marina]|uniref:Amino acid adenylation domain-containing protein n=1 Tax=Chengkuizengella marina TaxID=2507566 RepID=A0A6N9Q784_9BACL|nr:non-ribosomal peptide synthetase [Chengkuizengella marina]NBI30765.1 amino acid adenylation domain-containing protein [Chengkuizengella marina]